MEFVCSKCHVSKPDESFSRSKKKKNGRKSACKECLAKDNIAYQKENQEKIRAKAARWRASHPQEIRTYVDKHREANRLRASEWHATNKVFANQRSRDYYATHREEIHEKDKARYLEPERGESARERARAWQKNNPEKARAKQNNWRTTNPDKMRAQSSKRRARRRNAPTNDLTAEQWRTIKQQFDYRCAYCGKKSQRLSQDHIIPLAKGGGHTMHNVVPACRSCNCKKGTGPPLKPVQPVLL